MLFVAKLSIGVDFCSSLPSRTAVFGCAGNHHRLQSRENNWGYWEWKSSPQFTMRATALPSLQLLLWNCSSQPLLVALNAI